MPGLSLGGKCSSQRAKAILSACIFAKEEAWTEDEITRLWTVNILSCGSLCFVFVHQIPICTTLWDDDGLEPKSAMITLHKMVQPLNPMYQTKMIDECTIEVKEPFSDADHVCQLWIQRWVLLTSGLLAFVGIPCGNSFAHCRCNTENVIRRAGVWCWSEKTATFKKWQLQMLKSNAIECSGETNKQSSHNFSYSWMMLLHHLALTSRLMAPAAGAMSFCVRLWTPGFKWKNEGQMLTTVKANFLSRQHHQKKLAEPVTAKTKLLQRWTSHRTPPTLWVDPLIFKRAKIWLSMLSKAIILFSKMSSRSANESPASDPTVDGLAHSSSEGVVPVWPLAGDRKSVV